MPLLTKATHSHTHNHSARNITKQKIINSTHSTYTKSLFTKRNQNAKRTNANEKKKNKYVTKYNNNSKTYERCERNEIWWSND